MKHLRTESHSRQKLGPRLTLHRGSMPKMKLGRKNWVRKGKQLHSHLVYNIAMENSPYIDHFHIFSYMIIYPLATFSNQRVAWLRGSGHEPRFSFTWLELFMSSLAFVRAALGIKQVVDEVVLTCRCIGRRSCQLKDENVNGLVSGKTYRKPFVLPSNIWVSCKFSLHPILWNDDNGFVKPSALQIVTTCKRT